MFLKKRKERNLIIFLILFLCPIIFGNYSINLTQNQIYSTQINTSASIAEIDFSHLPEIDYDALNKSWYKPKIEMLIIAPEGRGDFILELEPLVEWKNQKGVKTIILDNYSLYGGRDPQESIRNMIKSFYESDGIRWVLLAGDAQDNLLPIRYVYNPDTRDIGSSEIVGNLVSKPTDYYYADLTGDWDEDEDNLFGESQEYNSHGVDEIDWIPEVYVGRLPANNAIELAKMVQKTLKYEKNPDGGEWMNRMLLAGGISDTISEEPPDGEDESVLTTYIWQNYVQDEMNFTHLWRSTSAYTPPDPKEPLNQTSFIDNFNEGYSTMMFAGHGAPFLYNDKSGTIYTNTNAQNCNNTNNPSLIYADACSTSTYDIVSGTGNDNSIGEILINQSNKGAIGYVGALRVTWYYTDDYDLERLNRANAKLFWREFFEEKKFQQGRTLYDSKVTYMNTDYYKYERILPAHREADRKNLLTYCLLGDPEVDIYTGIPSEVDNPFEPNYYEGQLLNITIKDNLDRISPYPRVHLKTDDGIYHTEYGDKNGNLLIRLPPGAGKIYNVSISGHNLIISNFSFTTIADTESPEILYHSLTPRNPTLQSHLNFTVISQDNESGIEGVFVLISKDNFNSYFYQRYPYDCHKDETEFNCITNRFEPGDYSYLYFIRDYLNHTDIVYESTFKFSIPTPVTYYLLIGSVVGIGIITIISMYTVYWSIKKKKKD